MRPGRIVDGQPQAPANIFALAPSEQVHRIFVKEPGGCGCGPTYTVTLTDARLLQRHQEYACCGDGARVDQMLFLSDIQCHQRLCREENLLPSMHSLRYPMLPLCLLLHMQPCKVNRHSRWLRRGSLHLRAQGRSQCSR